MALSTRRYKKPAACLSAQGSADTGTSILVQDYKHIFLEVDTASSADLTCKIQGSMSETAPDFSAAASDTNHWSYVAIIDLDDSANIAGSTGLASLFLLSLAHPNIPPHSQPPLKKKIDSSVDLGKPFLNPAWSARGK